MAELVDADGRRQTVRARALVNAAGPWVSRFLGGALGAELGKAGAAGQGLAHRRAQALRRRAPLHPAERRQADRVRDPVRGAIQPHRHHRRRLRGRARRGADLGGGDRLSLPRGQPLLPPRDHARRRRLVLCRRAPALRRRQRRRLGRHPRLRLRPRCRATARPRCSRSSAARSRPTASSPSTRWRSCSRCWASPRRPWTGKAPLPGGDLPGADLAAFTARARAATSLAARAPGSPLGAHLRQPDAGADRQRPQPARSRRGPRRRAATRPSCATSWRTNGRASPRTSSGAARGSACMSGRRSSGKLAGVARPRARRRVPA